MIFAIAAMGCGSSDDGSPDAAPMGEVLDPQVVQQLAAVKAATMKYQDPAMANADGYNADGECVSSADGGMGIHYFNIAQAQSALDMMKPVALLFQPTANGPVLVGVEYFQPVKIDGALWFETIAPPPTTAPTMFGRTFDGPMAGHSPTMPWHYDLHVWIYKPNPKGTFTVYNPSVSCTP